MAVEQAQIPTQKALIGRIDDKTNYDYLLIVVVATLLLIGLMMVYSTTFAIDPARPTYFFVRQLIWAGVGIVALVVFARIPYTFWRRFSVPMLFGVLALLLAVLIIGPGAIRRTAQSPPAGFRATQRTGQAGRSSCTSLTGHRRRATGSAR